MEQVKLLPRVLINKIRHNPTNFGFETEGFQKHIDEFSDLELSEMYYGVYKSDKKLLTDGDYFISLTDVVQAVCELASVTYFQKPGIVNYNANTFNSIGDIRTFYVKDYYLITNQEYSGTKKHIISRYLYKVGAINHGRNKFSQLYSVRNTYRVLQDFQEGLYPKDLFYPIKSYVNGIFFEDHYRISDFKVESNSITTH